MNKSLLLAFAIAMGCHAGTTGPVQPPRPPGGQPQVKLQPWDGSTLPQDVASTAVTLVESPKGWVALGVDPAAGKVTWAYTLSPDQAQKLLGTLRDHGHGFPGPTDPGGGGGICQKDCGGDWLHALVGAVGLTRVIARIVLGGASPPLDRAP